MAQSFCYYLSDSPNPFPTKLLCVAMRYRINKINHGLELGFVPGLRTVEIRANSVTEHFVGIRPGSGPFEFVFRIGMYVTC